MTVASAVALGGELSVAQIPPSSPCA